MPENIFFPQNTIIFLEGNHITTILGQKKIRVDKRTKKKKKNTEGNDPKNGTSKRIVIYYKGPHLTTTKQRRPC